MSIKQAEKLLKKGQYEEAANLYFQVGTSASNFFEKKRFFNTAACCYQSAGNIEKAMFCYISSDNIDDAVKLCSQYNNPKLFSQLMKKHGRTEVAVQKLMELSKAAVESKELKRAAAFSEEAFSLSESPVAEALNNLILGLRTNDVVKLNDAYRIIDNIDSGDTRILKWISFTAETTLKNLPEAIKLSVEIPKERKTKCPYCSAPIPLSESFRTTIRCSYCKAVIHL